MTNKPFLNILPMLVTSLLLIGCTTNTPQQQTVQLEVPPTNPPQQSLDINQPLESTMSAQEATQETTQVTLKTSKGDITLELYPQAAPNTVQNFLDKAQSGYYEGLTFHRVEDWVIQGGDPQGNGTGGGSMPTELSQVPFEVGSLGVARGGNIAVSNDSQFFICTDDCSWLTGQYTNFGKVVDGMDVALAMEVGDEIQGIEVAE